MTQTTTDLAQPAGARRDGQGVSEGRDVLTHDAPALFSTPALLCVVAYGTGWVLCALRAHAAIALLLDLIALLAWNVLVSDIARARRT